MKRFTPKLKMDSVCQTVYFADLLLDCKPIANEGISVANLMN